MFPSILPPPPQAAKFATSKGLEAAAKHFPPHVNKPQVKQGRGWESEWIWVKSQREGEIKSE